MANLKDLLVTGVARFLGTVQAKLFKGNLEGTSTNAQKDSKDQDISSTYIKEISKGTNSLTLTKGDGTNAQTYLNQYIASTTVVEASDTYPTLISWLAIRKDAVTYARVSGFTDLPTSDTYIINMLKMGNVAYIFAYIESDEGTIYIRSLSGNAWTTSWTKLGSSGGSSGDSNIVFENVADGTDLDTCIGYSGKITVYRCAGKGTGGFTNVPILPKTWATTNQGFCISINFNGAGVIGTDKMWVKQYYVLAHCGHVMTRYLDNLTKSDWAPEDEKFIIVPKTTIDSCTYPRSYDGIINYGSDLDLPATWYYVKYYANYQNQNGFGFQIFYPYFPITANTNDGIYYRIGGNTAWGNFKQIFTTDGGTINGNVYVANTSSIQTRHIDGDHTKWQGDLYLNYNYKTGNIHLCGPTDGTNLTLTSRGSKPGQLVIRNGSSWDTIFRHDGTTFYILVSDAAGGSWTTARPLAINSSGMCNINGDAGSVGGKTVSQLVTYDGLISTTTLASTNSPAYEGTINYGTSIGLPNSWWHVKNFHHSGNDGYSFQLFLPLENGQDAQLMYYRKANANGAAWGALQAVPTTNWIASYASVPHATSADSATLAAGLSNYNINHTTAVGAYKSFYNGVAGLSTETVGTSSWSTVFAFNCAHFYNQIGIDSNNHLFYRYNYSATINEKGGFTEPFHMVYSDNYKPYASGYFAYDNTSGNTISLGFTPSVVIVGGLIGAGVAAYSTNLSGNTTPGLYCNIVTNGFTVVRGLSSMTITTTNGQMPILNGGTAIPYIAFR